MKFKNRQYCMIPLIWNSRIGNAKQQWQKSAVASVSGVWGRSMRGTRNFLIYILVEGLFICVHLSKLTELNTLHFIVCKYTIKSDKISHVDNIRHYLFSPFLYPSFSHYKVFLQGTNWGEHELKYHFFKCSLSAEFQIWFLESYCGIVLGCSQ